MGSIHSRSSPWSSRNSEKFSMRKSLGQSKTSFICPEESPMSSFGSIFKSEKIREMSSIARSSSSASMAARAFFHLVFVVSADTSRGRSCTKITLRPGKKPLVSKSSSNLPSEKKSGDKTSKLKSFASSGTRQSINLFI